MSRPAKLYIDIDAFKHNLAIAKSYAKETKVMPIVKANAYGHGVQDLLSVLIGVDAIGVSCLEEAIELRQGGCEQMIMLMEGFFNAAELPLISKFNFQVVVHDQFQLKILQEVKLTKPIAIWIKCNTGMNRLGFLPEEIEQVYQQLMSLESVKKPINFMTHFSDADDIENTKTQKQLEIFEAITRPLGGLKTAANSAALISNQASYFDWVRPGIMLYGVSPFANKVGSEFNLKPVMTLTSEIIAISQCKKGDTIGYESTYECPEDMLVATVAMGYGDGYPRQAKNGTPVLVNNVIVPLVGRVSMDMLTIDLRKCPDAKVGDTVTFWGEGLPVEVIAQHANTIPYELLCRVDKKDIRIQRSSGSSC